MFLLAVLTVTSVLLPSEASNSIKCAYINSTIDKSDSMQDDLSEMQVISPDYKEVTCPASKYFCFTVWSELKDDQNNTVKVFLSQGCWRSSEKHECVSTACNGSGNPKFCCCSTDHCNANVTDLPFTVENTTDAQLLHNSYYSNNKVIVLFLIILGISTCVMFLLMYLISQGTCFNPVCKNKHCTLDSNHLVLNDRIDAYTYEQLKLVSVIGQGRYGCVWKAMVDTQEVAVKIFQSRNKQFFYNERDIYTLPFMDEPFLLRYFGADERIVGDNCVEYMLIFEHCSNGCLQDYLHCNTLDWSTFCRMVSSMARGLAYLHNDIHKNGKEKPCVCHRDFNSRNILVRSDLECRICDFGLAVKIQGSRYYNLGEEQHAETQCINDAGTLRYMAPEILEGAVNLRDCEASLKQIDMYAFGLVLWELATRCQDLYQTGVDIPPYKLPFESEVGLVPTFEKMQVLVSHNKARPLFPESWRDTSFTRLIRETIDDCWDQDAEARLTALCVEERMTEMSSCWDWSNKAAAMGYPNGLSPTVNLTQPSGPISNLTILDKNEFIVDMEGLRERNELTVNREIGEPLISFSPTEPNETSLYDKDSKNRLQQSVQPVALQPHQGRNPCMERNLMWIRSPSQENLNSLPTLIDRSSKHVPSQVTTTEAAPLIQNDFLGFPNYSRSINVPIPYVQNPVFDSSPSTKQCNVPRATDESAKSKVKSLFAGNNFSWSTVKNCKMKNSPSSDDEVMNPPKVIKSRQKMENLKKLESSASKLGKLLTDNNSYMPLNSGNKKKKNHSSSSLDAKVAIQFEATGGETAIEVNANTEDRKSDSCVPSVSRPNNLSLKKFEAQGDTQVFGAFSEGLKAPGLKDLSKRIKTPGDVPPSVRKKGSTRARFSLYDDRIMIENEEQLTIETTEPVSKTNSYSVPIDINRVNSID
nr:PREDICTED: activin receptor type-2A [Bemisia tabaci]